MGRARVLSVMAGSHVDSPARGEIWMAPAVLESHGLSNDAAGVAELAASLGADLCFVSCGGPQAVDRRPEAMRGAVDAVHDRGLACGVVVDGPWQKLSQDIGLFELLKRAGSRDDQISGELAALAAQVHAELTSWADGGADLVLLADDVAYTDGPYFSPATLDQLLLPLYSQFLASAADLRVPMGFHSDGDLKPFLSRLVAAGFSFFSLEPEAVDLTQARDQYGDRVGLLAGIASAWLYGEDRAGDRASHVAAGLVSLARMDRLILASSCGLSSAASLDALIEVYRAVDELSARLPDRGRQFEEG